MYDIFVYILLLSTYNLVWNRSYSCVESFVWPHYLPSCASFCEREWSCHHVVPLMTRCHVAPSLPSNQTWLCIVNCSQNRCMQTHSACHVTAPSGVIWSNPWLKARSVDQTAGAVSPSSWLMMPQAISQSNEGEVDLLRWSCSAVVC